MGRMALRPARCTHFSTHFCSSALRLAAAAGLGLGLGGIEALGCLQHSEEDAAADADPHHARLPPAAVWRAGAARRREGVSVEGCHRAVAVAYARGSECAGRGGRCVASRHRCSSSRRSSMNAETAAAALPAHRSKAEVPSSRRILEAQSNTFLYWPAGLFGNCSNGGTH